MVVEEEYFDNVLDSSTEQNKIVETESVMPVLKKDEQ